MPVQHRSRLSPTELPHLAVIEQVARPSPVTIPPDMPDSAYLHQPPQVVHLGGTNGLQHLSRSSTFEDNASDVVSDRSGTNDLPGHLPREPPTTATKKGNVRFTPGGWKGSQDSTSALLRHPQIYRMSVDETTSDLPFIQEVVSIHSRKSLSEEQAITSVIHEADAVNSAGHKLARLSSGLRLKPASSYRRQTVTDSTATLTTTGGATTESDYMDIALGSNTSANERRRHGIRGIPFWMRVSGVMAIPTIFLLIYLAMTFADAIRDYNYVQATAPAIEDIITCTTLLQRERRFATLYQLTNQSNALQMFAAHSSYVSNQANTNAECLLSLSRTLEESTKATGSSMDYVKSVKDALRTDLGLLRFSIERGLIGTTGARKRYGDLVMIITDGISVLAKESILMRRYLQLKAFRIARDATNLCGVVGIEVLRQRKALRKELTQEMNVNCMVVLLRALNDFRIIGGSELRDEYLEVSNGTLARLAIMRFQALAAIVQSSANYFEPVAASIIVAPPLLPLGNSPAQTEAPPPRYPWQLDTSPIPPVDFNETVFNNQRLEYSNLMDSISLSILQRLTATAELSVKVRDEGLKLFLSLVVSLIGIAFVTRAQRKSSEQVEFALNRTREMSRAVGAFVPRSFLKLMGVDSILHLERGDQTEVAVALLFCDIRNFTGISEHMSNEQLFEWLQAHLTRMTTTTERHHGFVDKFIGDAVSSVFLDSSKAVQCAIRMQTVTDARCYELIAENEDHLVKIGVGIHYATVCIGVLGNDKHHSCSIVSSEIAVPSQLEALTKEYGARILITEQVAERLREDEFENRLLGRVRLSKSSTKEYRVYEIFNADSVEVKEYKKNTATLWDSMVQAQSEENFALMQDLSKQLLQMASVVDPAAQLKSSGKLPYDQFDM